MAALVYEMASQTVARQVPVTVTTAPPEIVDAVQPETTTAEPVVTSDEAFDGMVEDGPSMEVDEQTESDVVHPASPAPQPTAPDTDVSTETPPARASRKRAKSPSPAADGSAEKRAKRAKRVETPAVEEKPSPEVFPEEEASSEPAKPTTPSVSVASIKKMTVPVLRKELTDRGLASSGKKAELVERLCKAMEEN